MTAINSPRFMDRPVLITGGSGFIGCNIADVLAESGTDVLIFDNMSRHGTDEHARWLRRRHGARVKIIVADIRDKEAITRAVGQAAAVLHLAAQVAVTTSLEHPADDFEVNASGTLNVLEAIRRYNPEAPLVFASTNKVYGKLLSNNGFIRHGNRYQPADAALGRGVCETTALDFYSPYGCSKGTADQYVHDYARVYGLRTAVLRMSCIYGPRQFGTEDQGWIAHFMMRAIAGQPITVFGDGLQVRDALHISDAVAAWLAVLDNINSTAGRILNLGGGPKNAISLLELLAAIEQLRGERPLASFKPWRPGDQPWYVSNTDAISSLTGWQPRISLPDGLLTLKQWLESRFGATAPPVCREVA
jgi:CDP-paratose 2-epimerase